MFRRTRNGRGESTIVAALAGVNLGSPMAKPNRSSNRTTKRNNHGTNKERFNNIKAFCRGAGHANHVVKPDNNNSNNNNNNNSNNKNRLTLLQLKKSTSTHFTRSTTHRSSVFDEPMTMSEYLLAEEAAAFENNGGRNDDDEEEAKEEITNDGNDQEVKPVIDQDKYGDPLLSSLAPSTDMNASSQQVSSVHRMSAPQSNFAMKKNENEELGRIQFAVDTMAEARAEAMRRQMPILCIEAEIPGDVTTGETIFSHPLIVEAAESLFVTVLQKPPQPQDDDDSCRRCNRYFSNSSCRTRVRILDDCAIDVLPPVERMTAALVVAAMVRGLESYRMRVPMYLRLLLEEESGKLQVLSKTRFREIQGKAVFGMFDAAMAEVELAGLDGVLATRSGSLVRQQVVQVTYDTRRISYGALVRHALRRTGANMIYYETNDQRIAAQLELQQFESFRQTLQQRFVAGQAAATAAGEEPIPLSSIKIAEGYGNLRATHHKSKPALRDSILKFVPMTDLQATRANRLIHLNRFDEAMHLLSPRQGLIAMESLRQHHNKSFHFHDVVDVPIDAAWKELCRAEVRPTEHDESERCHYFCLESEEHDDFLTDDEDDEADALYQ